jgi:thiosulfate/3-mercaptopyruvate sulfurtransferase
MFNRQYRFRRGLLSFRLMSYTTLIDTATLATLLTHPDVVVVDCRYDLSSPDAGQLGYLEGHVPGAVYAHLGRDLSGVKTGKNGRHPLPAPDVLAATLGRLGIDRRTQVVAYDQDSGAWAARLWWLLRWMGHEAAAVLDGGLAAWIREERALSTGVETRPARTFVGVPDNRMLVSASEVPALVAQPGSRLLDARAPERYRGEVEPIDPVGGHIPGAVNHFFQQNLSEGRFRSAADLRVGFADSLGIVDGSTVVCYCGSGVTACHNLLALEHAGLTGARLYAGSWSEWVADTSRPVEKG